MNVPDIDSLELIPHFQPIIRLDDRAICGYESLGRMIDPQSREIKSLGPIFHGLDADNPDHRRVLFQLDTSLQNLALERLVENPAADLFMNIMPHTLGEAAGGAGFRILRKIDQLKIDPSRIVLEITEDEFMGDIDQMVSIVQNLKSEGLKIAVDDAGAGQSDLNRIALIRPDIIKVDLQLLRASLEDIGFRQLLQTVSALSHRLGSSLLFEGIEREEELFMALRMGSRYLQGFLFSEARASFQEKGQFAGLLDRVIREHSAFAVAELIQGFQIRDELLGSMRAAASNLDAKNLNESLAALLSQFPHQISRLAIYDLDGNQLTSEFRIEAGGWVRDDSAISHNISWRPYFLGAIALSRYQSQDWFITEPHYTIQTEFPRIIVVLVHAEAFVIVGEADWLG
ncbi:MAG: EAL domain-containing protein [Leptospirales bacterium]|nr:EAL domain-containing protein [Leptospirales bacterium]HNN61299.1 EAL domain-containing protein [Leptospiraceae bacterium]